MKQKSTFIMLICFALFWAACSDDDEPIQAVTVNFTNQEAGISPATPSAEVGITFSRPVSDPGSLTLGIEAGDLIYGMEADYYSEPAASDGLITLPYEAGDEGVKFQIISGAALNIQEDKSITISLRNDEGNLITGTNNSVSIVFSENFIATEGTVELNAGGPDFPKQAYIDLSKLKQTTIHKYSWDLSFYGASGAHYVTLNSAAYTMARAIDKADLAMVSAEDTSNFSYEMQIPPPNFDPSIGGAAWVDSPDGDLEKTAIGTISSVDAENKVYIIKRDGNRNWKKVRILQKGDGYTIQHADIDAATFESIEIAKDENYNFTFLDLDKGVVPVEPAKGSWDFMYSTYTELLNLGAPGMDIPYGYKDYITINRYNTKAAMVMEDAIAYEAFSATNIESLDFEAAVNAIGANWRSGGGPTSAPALFDDRYFVIQDAEGTYFKLKFNRLTSTSGERGFPEFKFQQIQ